eukprot:jgi/Botrbrau1/14941/Bobra.0018s0045.1
MCPFLTSMPAARKVKSFKGLAYFHEGIHAGGLTDKDYVKVLNITLKILTTSQEASLHEGGETRSMARSASPSQSSAIPPQLPSPIVHSPGAFPSLARPSDTPPVARFPAVSQGSALKDLVLQLRKTKSGVPPPTDSTRVMHPTPSPARSPHNHVPGGPLGMALQEIKESASRGPLATAKSAPITWPSSLQGSPGPPLGHPVPEGSPASARPPFADDRKWSDAVQQTPAADAKGTMFSPAVSVPGGQLPSCAVEAPQRPEDAGRCQDTGGTLVHRPRSHDDILDLSFPCQVAKQPALRAGELSTQSPGCNQASAELSKTVPGKAEGIWKSPELTIESAAAMVTRPTNGAGFAKKHLLLSVAIPGDAPSPSPRIEPASKAYPKTPVPTGKGPAGTAEPYSKYHQASGYQPELSVPPETQSAGHDPATTPQRHLDSTGRSVPFLKTPLPGTADRKTDLLAGMEQEQPREAEAASYPRTPGTSRSGGGASEGQGLLHVTYGRPSPLRVDSLGSSPSSHGESVEQRGSPQRSVRWGQGQSRFTLSEGPQPMPGTPGVRGMDHVGDSHASASAPQAVANRMMTAELAGIPDGPKLAAARKGVHISRVAAEEALMKAEALEASSQELSTRAHALSAEATALESQADAALYSGRRDQAAALMKREALSAPPVHAA